MPNHYPEQKIWIPSIILNNLFKFSQDSQPLLHQTFWQKATFSHNWIRLKNMTENHWNSLKVKEKYFLINFGWMVDLYSIFHIFFNLWTSLYQYILDWNKMEVTSPTVAWARVVKKGEGRKEIMPSGIDKEERSFPTIKKGRSTKWKSSNKKKAFYC